MSSAPRPLTCLAVALGLLPAAQAADPVRHGPEAQVPAALQAMRDRDRLAILSQELDRARQRLQRAAQAAAARRAAHDAPGAAQAERMRTRALDDLAALQREIASTRHPPRAGPRARPPPAPRPPPASDRWWDVYARPPSTVLSGAPPFPPPSQGPAVAERTRFD